jgi:hypothetical protein
MPSVHIPDDVWLHVAEFIPSKALCSLYSVNHVFLALALAERYKEVNLVRCWDSVEEGLRYLKHLRYVSLWCTQYG